ncbi:MAG: 30S ribosomal protein S9 [Anaerolineae bacterium]|nr:30S ribosomal protein S9 [Anaerolineae bacterium]
MYYEGLGRRKSATARVRLHADGEGQFIVNGKAHSDYFGRDIDINKVKQPLELTQTENLFNVTVLVKGGGITGQSEAISMGVSRALLKLNPDLRPALRKAGLLTRDAREKERKKPGLKRARKAPQYTKR